MGKIFPFENRLSNINDRFKEATNELKFSEIMIIKKNDNPK